MSGDRPPRWHGRDPRDYQIVVLGSLLTYGLGWLDFQVSWSTVLAILSSCLFTQYACTRPLAPEEMRAQERADFRPVALPAAPHEFLGPRDGHRHADHR